MSCLSWPFKDLFAVWLAFRINDDVGISDYWRMKLKINEGNKWVVTALSLVIFFFLMSASPLLADDSTSDADWHYGAGIYLWAPKITATTPKGDAQLPFYQILDDLQMTFMGIASASRDKWTLSMDVVYMDLKEDVNRDREFQGPGNAELNVTGDVNLKNWIVTPTVGYAVLDSEQTRIEILGGVRYLWLKSSLALNLNGNERVNRSVSESYWDAVIGARASIKLNERWFLPLYFDIGTGDSDGTWQGFAGVGYEFNSFNTVLAYRYLDYKFDESNVVMEEMNVKGPFLGLMFKF